MTKKLKPYRVALLDEQGLLPRITETKMNKIEARLLGAYPRTMLEALPTPELFKLFTAHQSARAVNYEANPETALGMVEMRVTSKEIQIEVDGTGGDEPIIFRGTDPRQILIDYLEA